LIEEMYKSEIISDPVFGFYLTGVDGQSYLDIGRLQDSAMRDKDELVWLDVVDNDFWWTNYLTGVKFTSADGFEETSYSLESAKALTDSGTSCVYMPANYYDEILKEIKAMSDDPSQVEISYEGDIIVDCSIRNKMPTVSFLLGGYWMEMIPEDYIVEYDGFCFACLGAGDFGVEQEWLLGDAFLRGFYSVHDHKDMRYGFAPHAESTKTAAYSGTTPSTPMP